VCACPDDISTYDPLKKKMGRGKYKIKIINRVFYRSIRNV
jgi:hypothetical protein